MAKFAMALLLLACLPLLAQKEDVGNKFVGTWEAKWKDTVICTIRVTPVEPIFGETKNCSIHVDGNGDLLAPEATERSDDPEPMLNAKIHGETLTFEEKDGEDVMKFELKLVGDGRAALKILNAPVRMNPIQFARR